jgi:hypothetical protein
MQVGCVRAARLSPGLGPEALNAVLRRRKAQRAPGQGGNGPFVAEDRNIVVTGNVQATRAHQVGALGVTSCPPDALAGLIETL